MTRELHETIVVRSPKSFRSFCGGCKAENDFLAFDAAVSFCGLRARKILFEIESGAVHAQETASGHLFVCRQSLEKKLKEL
ncbi:MAG: hypothetical protein ACR2HG_01155 [Pyrinomonadaceae bacterium]